MGAIIPAGNKPFRFQGQTMKSRCPAFVLLGLVSLFGPVAAHAESWLTPAEQEFFAALGLDAKVGGRSYQRKADYAALHDIGNAAPEPLKSRILAIAQAYPRLSLSPEEKKKFESLMLEAAEDMRTELRKTVGAALLNQDSQKRAVDATNAMLKEGGAVRKFWEEQTRWYVQEVKARESLAKNMQLITADLERRSGRARPASDLELALGVGKRTLAVTGKVGSAPLSSTVVQVVIHKAKAKANGGLSALNLASTGLLQSMGVEMLGTNLENSPAVEGMTLTKAQEKSFDLPIIKTFGLPKLSPGARFSIDLDEDLNDVIFFERVSLKAWTPDGTITIDSIPSLEHMQQLREETPREDRFRDPPSGGLARSADKSSAPKTPHSPAGNKPVAGNANPLPGNPLGLGGGEREAKRTPQQAKAQAQREAFNEQQALGILNRAKAALAKKQHDQARIYLNQVIALAPESRSAATAKSLLKKLEP
jgi:hypothetical protein